MDEIVKKVLHVIKNQKLLILKVFSIYLIFLVVFMVLMFPFNYLSSYLTTTVAKSTNNQVFLKSKDIHLTLIPSFGVELEEIEFETASLPKFTAQKLIFAPGIFSLLKNIPTFIAPVPGETPPIPNFTVKLYDFLGSNTVAQIKDSDSKQQITVNTEKLELKKLSSLSLLPIELIGELNLDLSSLVDMSFKEQPEADLQISVAKLTIPNTNIALPQFGSLPLPRITVSDVKIKARIIDGVLYIEQASLGRPNEALNLNLRGQVEMTILPSPRGNKISWGPYNFQTIFHVNSKLADDLYLTSLLKDKQVKKSRQKITYGMRLVGRSFYSPPTSFEKINSLPSN